MDKDRKSTALKALQGHIWREGYEQEKLKAEYVYKISIATYQSYLSVESVCNIYAKKIILNW